MIAGRRARGAHARALVSLLAAATLLWSSGCGTDDRGESLSDLTEEHDDARSGDIVDDPRSYLGERVSVEGTVSVVYNENAFELDADGSSIIVVAGAAIPDLRPGRSVEATGTLLRLRPSTLTTDLRFEWEEVYNEHVGRHAVIATSVDLRAAGQ